ncbi:MAG: DMT family transporter [Candidatus Bathyarchaeia archaeon]
MARCARYGTAAAFTVAVIWGLSFVAARMVLSTLTPILLATVRFVIASAIFAPIIIMELRHGNALAFRDLGELALLGFLSISIYFWLQYTGVKYAGAGVSALLVVGLIPILTGLASAVLLKERFSVQKALGTALGLIAVPGLLLEEVDWLFYLGVASLLLNAVCWALYSTLSRRLMSRIKKPATVTAYVTVLGTLALVPMSLTSDWGLIASIRPGQWLSILYLSTVCSGLGYFLWNYALSKVEAVRAAVWLYLEPVAAFMGEAAIFGVMPGPATLIGGGAIIIGALLATRSRE